MKLDVLREKFLDRYPAGDVFRRKSDTVGIVYSSPGKIYDYSGAVYQIAENLDLIPVYDHMTEVNRVKAGLLSDQESMVSCAGLVDTLRSVITNHYVLSEFYEYDEFDRELSRYFLGDFPVW